MKLKEIKPGMIIHCKTFEEANQLLAILDKAGYKWITGFSLVRDTNYRFHESLTCYRIDANRMLVSFCDISFYENNGDEIIEFSSLIIEEKTYEDGLNEAWAAAKKIVLGKEHGGLSCDDLEKIFERDPEWEVEYSVFKNLTPQETIAKLEAYEEEKPIKVGDVVIGNIFKGVVTAICNGRAFIMYDDGSSKEISINKCQKTGKHIDISSILAEIGKE